MIPLSIDELAAANETTIIPLGATPSATGKRKTFAELKAKRVTHETKHPAPEPVILVSGANFGMKGMISALTGPPKSGKTTVIGFIMATAFAHYSDPAQSLGIQSSYANGRDVVFFDFEQHVSSTQDLQDKVLRYANLSKTPDNLHIISLNESTMAERMDAIETAFAECDLHLLIIDGLADVLTSVNDEEKSNALIERLGILASQHNTCVLTVVHENKGGGSVRGHLGSQIERKCAGLLSVRKDRERKIHSIESRLIRIGDDFETVYFHWCNDEKRMILCDAITADELKADAKQTAQEKKAEYLSGLVKLCFGPFTQLSINDFRAAVMKHKPTTTSAKNADLQISKALDSGLVTVEGEKTSRMYTIVNLSNK